MNQIKAVYFFAVSSVTSFGAGTLVTVNAVLQAVSFLVGIVSGLIAIAIGFHVLRIKIRELRKLQCETCDGTGNNCPFAPGKRPHNCRLNS